MEHVVKLVAVLEKRRDQGIVGEKLVSVLGHLSHRIPGNLKVKLLAVAMAHAVAVRYVFYLT